MALQRMTSFIGLATAACAISLASSTVAAAPPPAASGAEPDGGPVLFISGTCAGTTRLVVKEATPGGKVAFLFARATGSFVIPSGVCTGVGLGLDRTVQIAGSKVADGDGVAKLFGRMPRSLCGRLVLQAIDLTTCGTTNVVEGT